MEGDIVLGIDNSMGLLCLALSEGENFIEGRLIKGKRASEILPLEVLQLLSRHGYSTKDICTIIFTTGPGSYTGLRVVISFIKGFFASKSISVVGIPTFDVLASPFFFLNGHYLCPIMDAKKGEVFFALYKVLEKETRSLIATGCTKIEKIEGVIKRPCVIFGNAVSTHRNVLSTINDVLLVEDGFSFPEPFFLIKEGLKREREYSIPELFYGKSSDAEIKFGLKVT